MQLHKPCGFNHWQRHVTAKMSDFPWRKIKTVVFQIPAGWGRAFVLCLFFVFNWRLSSDGTETGRDSWSQRDNKLDVCIAMVNRNNNIDFFFLLSPCFNIFLCIYLYCFSSLITCERSYQSQITLRCFSSKVAPCRRNKRNNRANFLLSAEKEETVVKEKVGKKNQGYSTSACLSFFFLFSNR